MATNPTQPSGSRSTRETFHIPALDCPEEFVLVDKGLSQLDGIRQVSPNYVDRSVRVTFDPEHVTSAAIAEQLKKIGFPTRSPLGTSGKPMGVEQPIRLRGTTLAGGVVLLLASISWFLGAAAPWIGWLCISSAILSGWHVAAAAVRALKLGRLEMNTLMTIAAIGAAATGEWFEAATAMFLFGVSLWLESYSMNRARRAVQSLVALSPPVAHRMAVAVDRGTALSIQSPQAVRSEDAGCCGAAFETDVDPASLRVGDVVLVKPGERVPVDGEVIAGHSSVDQAPLTGESIPIDKSAGDHVFAGSLNREGALEVRATKPATDTMLAHVARLVEQARASKSPTERFVDRFARWYTPVVIALAIVIAVVPPVLGQLAGDGLAGLEFREWLHRGLVLLVIACPCALVISTPVTVVCGLHRATRYGMLVKGGEFLESAGRVNAVAIDKTGTLTVGRPRVVAVHASHGEAEETVLRVAAALESRSEHPLAAAIVEAARERGVRWSAPDDFTAIRGLGVEGTVDGVQYTVASVKHFRQQGLPVDDRLACENGRDAAVSVALVGTRDRFLGALELVDAARSDAARSVADWKSMGIGSIVMLTGDGRAAAKRVAREVGIDEVHFELLPHEKIELVRQLATRYSYLAMVGDGVNDAPALTAARLGIALGAQASDTALETADVVVLSPHLRKLGQLFRLGRRTRRLLWQNITFALAIKLAVLILAAFGLATMWMAVAADVGASMLVIFNGMRLLSVSD